MVIAEKLMVFVLMFAILVVIRYVLDIAKAYKDKKTSLDWTRGDYITVGVSLSYILTTIFTGFSLF